MTWAIHCSGVFESARSEAFTAGSQSGCVRSATHREERRKNEARGGWTQMRTSMRAVTYR